MSKNKNLLPDYEGHDLTNYNNFLLECLEKDYSGQGTQKHHIYSKKFMGGTDDESNLIILNYQDHYKAHLILAECFPKGNKLRGKNYGSAKLIVGYVKQHLKKRYGEDISEHWEGFWEIAHREVCELNKGENHAQFGDKFTPERCKQMSDVRKGTRIGELNSFYGKKHSEETKEIIREARSKRKPEIVLPEGIFRCDEVVDGMHKNLFRFCPDCGVKMFYSRKETQADLKKLCERNPKCKKCATRKRPPEHLSNRIIIKDTRTGIIYNSQTDAMKQLKLLFGVFKEMVDIGIFEVVENKSSWNKRRANKE